MIKMRTFDENRNDVKGKKGSRGTCVFCGRRTGYRCVACGHWLCGPETSLKKGLLGQDGNEIPQVLTFHKEMAIIGRRIIHVVLCVMKQD
jgi:hypothetical protein